MKVLLVCAAGMSTTLLTENMRRAGSAEDVIDACPESELDSRIDDYDVVLLGPQIRFKLKEIQAKAEAKGKQAGVIDMRIYGMMDGKSAMEQARELLA